MNKKLIIHLPIGSVTIGSLNSYYHEFLNKEKIKYSQCIRIPIVTQPSIASFDSFNNDSTNIVQAIDIKLTKNLLEKFPINKYMKYDEKFIEDQLIKVLNDSFISHIMKRKEQFYKPKLEMEDIQNLCIELAKNSYNNNVYAFHVELNKYQKYFIFVNEQAFKFFISGPRHEDFATTALFAQLVELYPNGWISGRYDESVYLKELYANNRYGI